MRSRLPIHRLHGRALAAMRSSILDVEASGDVDLLEQFAALIEQLKKARDEQIYYLKANGIPASELAQLTGLSSRRIRQIASAPPPQQARAPARRLKAPAKALEQGSGGRGGPNR